jgi:hypothetical protein
MKYPVRYVAAVLALAATEIVQRILLFISVSTEANNCGIDK